MSLTAALDQIGHPRLLVLGDLMLDRYTWGNADRVSPEAPVLVLQADLEEVRLGGAASVATLLRGLDADVILAGVVGDDAGGRTIQKLLADDRVEQSAVLCDPTRPTTTKERFIGRAAGRHPHQMLRVDHEARHSIANELETALAAAVIAQLPNVSALLISDYAKGVCTPHLLENVIRAAAERGIPVIIDPARIADYTRYRGAALLKPNRMEAQLATNLEIRTPEDAFAAGQKLCADLDLQAAVITLDQDGMVLVRGIGFQPVAPPVPPYPPTGHTHRGTGFQPVRDPAPPTQFTISAQSVYDITGAGDMALAALGLCQAAGLDLPDSVQVANLAAGLEVARLGVCPITRHELQAEISAVDHNTIPKRERGRALQSPPQKLVTLTEMEALAAASRNAGQKIVFTNGCFDLLHVGHAAYLAEAARLGDVLIVAVNSDASVRRLKGPGRPIVGEADRAALLAALACVDHVLVFDEPTPHELLRRLRPDVLVKGGTYTPETVVGREVVESYGGRICVTGQTAGRSTTNLLSSIRSNQ